jgi:hypothetical protein
MAEKLFDGTAEFLNNHVPIVADEGSRDLHLSQYEIVKNDYLVSFLKTIRFIKYSVYVQIILLLGLILINPLKWSGIGRRKSPQQRE